MDSQEDFFNIIWSFYNDVSKNKIPAHLLSGLSETITSYYYKQYYRFGIQYPKSVKRYSSFQIKDLDHPTIFEMVIKYFKDHLGNDYSEYTKIILNMTDSELKAFEKSREAFYKMF